MKKYFILTISILLLAAACNRQQAQVQPAQNQPVSNAVNSNGANSKEKFFQNYANVAYHFSLDVPKEEYAGQNASGCDESEAVKITENGNVITIGTKFTNCPAIDPDFLNGWTIYAANKIDNQQDAQKFLDKQFSKGCKITEWGNPVPNRTENDPGAFFIESLNSTDANPSGDCQFSLMSKYRTFYSPTFKTMVFWSLGQQVAFLSKDGGYDDQVLNSFKFTK